MDSQFEFSKKQSPKATSLDERLQSFLTSDIEGLRHDILERHRLENEDLKKWKQAPKEMSEMQLQGQIQLKVDSGELSSKQKTSYLSVLMEAYGIDDYRERSEALCAVFGARNPVQGAILPQVLDSLPKPLLKSIFGRTGSDKPLTMAALSQFFANCLDAGLQNDLFRNVYAEWSTSTLSGPKREIGEPWVSREGFLGCLVKLETVRCPFDSPISLQELPTLPRAITNVALLAMVSKRWGLLDNVTFHPDLATHPPSPKVNQAIGAVVLAASQSETYISAEIVSALVGNSHSHLASRGGRDWKQIAGALSSVSSCEEYVPDFLRQKFLYHCEFARDVGRKFPAELLMSAFMHVLEKGAQYVDDEATSNKKQPFFGNRGSVLEEYRKLIPPMQAGFRRAVIDAILGEAHQIKEEKSRPSGREALYCMYARLASAHPWICGGLTNEQLKQILTTAELRLGGTGYGSHFVIPNTQFCTIAIMRGVQIGDQIGALERKGVIDTSELDVDLVSKLSESAVGSVANSWANSVRMDGSGIEGALLIELAQECNPDHRPALQVIIEGHKVYVERDGEHLRRKGTYSRILSVFNKAIHALYKDKQKPSSAPIPAPGEMMAQFQVWSHEHEPLSSKA
jgi:hypothetical protein